jgi:hypothetical protein
MTEQQPASSSEEGFTTTTPLKPATPAPPPGNFEQVKNYYSKTTGRPNLFSKFRNIDLDDNLLKAKSHFSSLSTKNFVVDFGHDDAWYAPNLEKDDLVALLEAEVCCVPSNGPGFAIIGGECLLTGNYL